MLGVAIAVGVVALTSAAARADEASKGKDDWENQFAGHELWNKSLSKAIALSVEESKPLLIDFYSHG